MNRFKHLIHRMEVQVWPPCPMPDDLNTLSDDDLMALWRWCAQINGLDWTHTLLSLSEAKVAALAEMDADSADAYIQERMR